MKKTKTVARCAVLITLAFALNWAETLIPPFVPVPGFKLGLSNVVTLFALYRLGGRCAFSVFAGRCILTLLLFGNASSFIFSACGGLAAFAVMLLLKRFSVFSHYGVSVAGAAAHNIGQTTAAAVLMRTVSLYSYLLLLLPVGILTGMLNAFIFKRCERVRIP